MDVLRSMLGIAVFIGLCWLFSKKKKAISWRLVAGGLGLQLVFALLLLKTDFVRPAVRAVSDGFVKVTEFSHQGAGFIFGDLAKKNVSGVIIKDGGEGYSVGDSLEFHGKASSTAKAQVVEVDEDGAITRIELSYGGRGYSAVSTHDASRVSVISRTSKESANLEAKLSFDVYGFGFSILPSILFFSALSSILYYLGILQRIVFGLAWLMKRTMKLSGAECLAASANVFVGQTEAPLLVRPYLDKMTRSEILCLMTGGFATIAGGVFAVYVSFLGPEYAEHLLTASLMSAPAAIVCAKILLPETKKVDTSLQLSKGDLGTNVFDAAAKGTSQGLLLAFNVGAILIVFTALVALLNYFSKDLVGYWTGLNHVISDATDQRFDGLTLQYLLGIVFAPFAWLVGVAPEDVTLVGQLLGEKLVLNEFVAYLNLGSYRQNEVITDPRTLQLTAYALCGFANFASVGIQVAGIAILAPKQRENLASLAWRALLGGTIACFMTASVAGILL
ncbi:MAG: NupC/NupG family nucleoside CNT transporter [Opitutae bacterium]|nr:NupC/NupG family nucleoside CNT transporter [Opitutae bacterium]|tara:strand:+ start:2545 stop:4056 length:1512 start_codon:yes stop_codon:yes gene_type:complete